MSTIKPAGQQMAFFPHDASASQDPKIQRLMYRTVSRGTGAGGACASTSRPRMTTGFDSRQRKTFA